MAQEYTEEQAMGAIKNAHAAGDNDAVNQWADYLDNMKGVPVESAPQEQVEPEKEETFGRGFVETKSLPQNLADLAVAATGFAGTLSYRDEDGYGLGYTSTEERYGEDFGDLSFDERRVRINERDAAEVERQYPNQTGSTFGKITGAVTDPSIAVPIGQTYKVMALTSAGLAGTYSAADQLMDKGEVDLLEVGAHAAAAAVLAPVLGYGLTKVGEKISAKLLPNRIKKANKAITDLNQNVEHAIFTARESGTKMTRAQALEQAKKNLKLNDNQILQAQNLSGRKVKYPTKAGAQAMAESHKKAGMLSEFVEGISSRIGTLSQPVLQVMRRYEKELLKNTQARKNIAAPLTKSLEVYDPAARKAIDDLLLNGNYTAAGKLLNKGGKVELKKFQKLMNEDTARLKKILGKKFQTMQNYFPRKVKDYEGLLGALGREGSSPTSGLQKAVKDLMKKEGVTDISQLSDESLSKTIQFSINKAFPTVQGGKGFTSGRTLQEIPPELTQFYESSSVAMIKYIESSSRFFEKHKLLGRGAASKDIKDENSLLFKTIAKQLTSKNLSVDAGDELESLIISRFTKGEQAMNSKIAAIKDIGYMSALGQFRSAVTQIKDVGTSAYLHGTMPTIKALFKYKSTKVQDAGLVDTVSAEMLTPSATKKWLDGALKYSGFRFSDRFGKKVLIEASQIAGKKLASSTKGVAKLKKKYGAAYGDDFEQLVTSLKNGTEDELTELYRFHELSNTQPISLLEMPKAFLDFPNGRIAYSLKSFGLKQLTLIHNNIIKRAKGGDKLGATKEALKYASFIGIAGGTVDEVKGVFSGEDFNTSDIPDRVIENLTGLMFLSKYSLGDISKGDYSGFIGDWITPALGPLEAATREVGNIGKQRELEDPSLGSDLLKTMPIIGRVLHDWVLGGKEKAAADREKEIMEQFD